MHLAPVTILHVFKAGKKRSEVQTVSDKRTPFRVVCFLNGDVVFPYYFTDLDRAMEHAKWYAFHEHT